MPPTPLLLPHPPRRLVGAMLGAAALALGPPAAHGQGGPSPDAPAPGPVPAESPATGEMPALAPADSSATSASPAPPLAPAPTSPPPPPPPTVAPPIYTPGSPPPYAPGYPPPPRWQRPGAWPPAPEPPGMNDATMFYVSAVVMGIGCAMMTPLLLRLDIAGQPDLGDVPKVMGIYAGGALGYPLYLAATPLAMTGALPALAPDQERRSDGALAAGIVLTMLGAAAAPVGAVFASTAARKDFDPGPGIGFLVTAGVGLGSGVPLMVWGAAPVEAPPPPAPYLALRF